MIDRAMQREQQNENERTVDRMREQNERKTERAIYRMVQCKRELQMRTRECQNDRVRMIDRMRTKEQENNGQNDSAKGTMIDMRMRERQMERENDRAIQQE